MHTRTTKALLEVMKILFKPHPWHGIFLGDSAPELVRCYIEIVPTDTVKYEIEKTTGYLKVDRPQRFSNASPCLYGLLPRTLCGARVAALASGRTGLPSLQGDQDPLDVCVFSERPITHGDLLLEARPIGGLQMIDGHEADDKIIAVLKDDAVFGKLTDISEFPDSLIQRLVHYFLTYKQLPGDPTHTCEIRNVYGRQEAYEVIRQSEADYEEAFGNIAGLIAELLTPATVSQ